MVTSCKREQQPHTALAHFARHEWGGLNIRFVQGRVK
jgi:hypothetical protein